VLESFPDKVKVVFKNFPLLKIHRFAGKAALTAYAAHLQGKFWPIADELFKAGESLNDEKVKEIVRAQGLDEARIERDRDSPRVVEHVQGDLDEAYRLGVDSVPAVFINGKRLRDRSFESFAAAIDKELKKNPAKK
jgi:protein-disulfide isomerase